MKVLVVDDRAENRIILETKLRAAGYEVESANNGVEGLRKLRSQKYDLVITDLMMPQMDGYQMMHTIKTDDALKDTPVLVYTATYIDAKDEALAFNLGANAFLRKPATDEEFFANVRKVLDQAARGKLPARAATTEELTYLRQYSERLIHKLEDKVHELETAERQLRDLNATLEQRVKDATAELREANQELEAFAYSVSHDLRAPLRSIEGFVEVLQTDEPPVSQAEHQQYLNRIRTLASQAQRLITDLLEYSQLKSANLPLAPVSLAATVNAALDRLDPASRAEARIDVGNLPSKVVAHEATLVQAAFNILSNALKFTKPATAAHVIVSEQSTKGWTRLNFTDHGIGIEPQHSERIFQAFERLHDNTKYPGTGVGLAIVQRAVQKMRGRVGVESTKGEGSTFWIELPTAT